MPKFTISPDAAGEFRWKLQAANGEVLASGEGYKTRAGARRGIAALKRCALLAKLIEK
jgi:uncharacterized protein YegP (UPF0339 family)